MSPLDREQLQRVVLVGTSGAGKSFTGERLARLLNQRFFELDELFWSKGWQPKPTREFLALVRDAAAGDRWVAAGNYSSARTELWQRASAIVWLNFSLPVVLGRLIGRTAQRVLRGQVLWHGNRESLLRTLCTRESIIWWAISTHNRRKREFLAARASGQYPHLHWYEFRHPSEVERFLAAEG